MTYILDTIRVPCGKKGGIYRNVLPEELTAFLLKKLKERNDFFNTDKAELILGNSIGTLGNMARNAALRAGFSETFKATTLDFQCGGTYDSLRLGRAVCLSELNDFAIIGGMESNSLMPLRQYVPNDPRYISENDRIQVAEFSPYHSNDLHKAAEKLANDYFLEKEEMLNWTIRSHQKATRFSVTEVYKQFVLPFFENHEKDEMIRPGINHEFLQKTASKSLVDRTNTAHYHDGAGLALLASEHTVEQYGIKPLARVRDVKIIGLSPDKAPLGCILAAEELLRSQQLKIDTIDLFEINESFAAKPLAFMKHFGIREEQMNVFGGNLAMGHPYAASGIINILNMILALKEKNLKFGLVTAGIAGGYGAAVLLENVS
jgi:acetyl-CoA C-acetyltransferase